MLGRSLLSKGFVTVVFNWRHYYYSLTNDGIQFLRSELGIEDASVKPTTHRARNDTEEVQKRGARGPRPANKDKVEEAPKVEVEVQA